MEKQRLALIEEDKLLASQRSIECEGPGNAGAARLLRKVKSCGIKLRGCKLHSICGTRNKLRRARGNQALSGVMSITNNGIPAIARSAALISATPEPCDSS